MFYENSRPWTRWWWFNVELKEEDIRAQLDWVKANGFGGVELSFVYPLADQPRGPDWLSPEWSAKVAFAKRYCDSIGLGCDFTFGTLWPFGGTFVSEADSSQVFSVPSPVASPQSPVASSDHAPSSQRLGRSWELPAEGRILNHLDADALERYSEKVGQALSEALSVTLNERPEGPELKGLSDSGDDPGEISRVTRNDRQPSALFCDSWEVETEGLWTEGFGEKFQERFGYDLRPFMPELDKHPDIRYDYHKLLAEYVLDGFYRPFTDASHRLNSFTRVQCHGAPTDLLAAFAAVDVPESEAILFDPEFSAIPASAAALAGKPVVSAEAFTCLYGWNPYPGPGPHQGEEQVADLKLLADALFANGVNHVFWHGMPYQTARAQAQAQASESSIQNPKPKIQNHFYASVHVGPDGTLAPHLPEFNAYIEKVCAAMKPGRTYSDVAVYLPLEDNLMRGELPKRLQKPSAKYHWEMHYQRMPDELAGFQPLWVSHAFLKDAVFEDRVLRCGDTTFSLLYVDSEWLDSDALDDILRLARLGLPVCLKQKPKQPGHVPVTKYKHQLSMLMSLPHVSPDFAHAVRTKPLVAGDNLPPFWCRAVGDDRYIFFANPAARGLAYPMEYGCAHKRAGMPQATSLKLQAGGDIGLRFEPYQSLLLRVSKSGATDFPNITYAPAG